MFKAGFTHKLITILFTHSFLYKTGLILLLVIQLNFLKLQSDFKSHFKL